MCPSYAATPFLKTHISRAVIRPRTHRPPNPRLHKQQAGVIAFTRSLDGLGPAERIRVNVVCPSYTATPFLTTVGLQEEGQTADMQDALEKLNKACMGAWRVVLPRSLFSYPCLRAVDCVCARRNATQQVMRVLRVVLSWLAAALASHFMLLSCLRAVYYV